MELDESKIKKVTEHQTRNAGRKKKEETKKIENIPSSMFIEQFEELGATKLADKYNVNRRTIYRYLEKALAEKDHKDNRNDINNKKSEQK